VPKQSLRQAHSFPDNLMHCYAVNFQLKNLQGNDAMLPFAIVSHIGDNPELIHLFDLLTSAWKAQQPGYRLECRGLLMLILHRLFKVLVFNDIDLVTTDYRIRRVLQYIAQHYAENITVRKMTTMTKLSAHYLGALFKRTTGVTVKYYLKQTRIKNAESMLRSGKYKVAEIARHCGYKDIFFFYKQFKEITGLTLSQFMPKKPLHTN
jgi:AraC-like DNA-binding protein